MWFKNECGVKCCLETSVGSNDAKKRVCGVKCCLKSTELSQISKVGNLFPLQKLGDNEAKESIFHL